MRSFLALTCLSIAAACGSSNGSGGGTGDGGTTGGGSTAPYTTRWAHAFSGIDNISDPDHHSLGITPGGGAVLGGAFWAPIDLGEGVIQPLQAAADEAFIVGLGASGAPAWNHHFNAPNGTVRCTSLSSDASGNIGAIVTATKPVELGAGSVDASSGSAIVASFDVAGKVRFAKAVGGGTQHLHELSATDQGHFVVAGLAGSGSDVFGTSVSGDSAGDALVFEVDASGALVWSASFAGSGLQQATHVAAASDGPVVTATSTMPVDVGGQKMMGAFAAKLDTHGNVKWTHALSAPADAVAADSASRAYVAIGGDNGNKSTLVALDASGGVLWQHDLEGSPSGSTGNVRGIAADARGHVFVTGKLANALRVDGKAFGDAVSGAASFASYVLALDAASGTPLWIRSFGGDAQDQEGEAIVAGADGSIVVKGAFTAGHVDLGTGPLENKGDKAAFIALLVP